jgi:regulator of protease activity HflC (stomatin/prohibitin superfamily)
MSSRSLVAIGAVALGGLILANASLFSVSETEQAITLQFGQPQRVFNIDGRDPGLKVMIPFVQQRYKFDRRILDLETTGKSEIVTADQERLEVDSFARWRIVNPLRFYQRVVTEDIARSRLRGFLEASLRRVLGSTRAGDIISGRRAELMGKIRSELNREAATLGIEVVDVRIRAADLPQANQERVFQPCGRRVIVKPKRLRVVQIANGPRSLLTAIIKTQALRPSIAPCRPMRRLCLRAQPSSPAPIATSSAISKTVVAASRAGSKRH